jgi:hypothetical protein
MVLFTVKHNFSHKMFTDNEKSIMLDVFWHLYKDLFHIVEEHIPEAQPSEWYESPELKIWMVAQESVYPFILFVC